MGQRRIITLPPSSRVRRWWLLSRCAVAVAAVQLQGVIPTELQALNLPRAVLRLAPDVFPSLTAARKACRKGAVLIEGQPQTCAYSVTSGERYSILQPASKGAGDGSTANGLQETIALEAVLPEHAFFTTEDLPKLPAALCAVHPEHFPTLSAARRAVRHGRVLLNGLRSTCAALCAPGDRISLLRAAAADSAAAADPAALLELLYEDAWCGVVVKPQGLPVHGWGSKSLVGRLSTQLQWQQQQQEQLGTGQQQQQPQPLQQRSTSSAAQQHDAPLEKPAFPHRLDTRTGGVLAFATTAAAAAALNEAFRARRVSKRYAAIVVGVPDCTEVLLPLDGKSCSTTVEVMATIASVKYGRLSLVHLWPRTGRKHQLRRHMSLTGTPIIGDAKYELEGGVKLAGPDLMLFAAELRFDHPVVEGVQVCVEADRPENMMQFWEQQQRYWAQRNS